MRKERLRRQDSIAQAASLMQATSYTVLEATPVSSDKPLGSIQEGETGAEEEALQALLLGNDARRMTSAPVLSIPTAASADPDSNPAFISQRNHGNPMNSGTDPLPTIPDAADPQHGPTASAMIPMSVSTPIKASAATSLTTLVAADAQPDQNAAALTRQDLVTPMKGATAMDLADVSVSEDPETWLMGAVSIDGAASSHDALSVPSSPLANANPADRDMMQFSPGTLAPDTPFAVTNAEQHALHVEVSDSNNLVSRQAQSSTDSLIPAALTRLPSVKERIAILDRHVPLTGQHHGQRQKSPERQASPTSLRVIAENFEEEMLIGAHHGEQERSPKKSSAAQLLVTDECTEVVLVGSHHLSRQPLSPVKQCQPALDLETQELLLLGAHQAERQRSPRKNTQEAIAADREENTCAAISHSQDSPLVNQAGALAAKEEDAAEVLTGNGKLLQPQQRVATEQIFGPHEHGPSPAQATNDLEHQEQLPASSEDLAAQAVPHGEPPYQATSAGAASSNLLGAQTHGKGQKRSRKTPKWLQRVVSLSRPGSPLSTGIDADSAVATSQIDGSQHQIDGPQVAIKSTGTIMPMSEASAELSEEVNVHEHNGSGNPPSSWAQAEDEDLPATDGFSHAPRDHSEPESPLSNASGGHDASERRVPSKHGGKPVKRGQRGSRLLQKVLSGLSGKTSPRKLTAATIATDALLPVPENPVSTLPTQLEGQESANDNRATVVPADMPDSDAGEAAAQGQPGVVTADKPAGASPAGLRGSIESMDSLQMDELLADTPFKGLAPVSFSALPEPLPTGAIPQTDLAAGTLTNLLPAGNSDAQPLSRKLSPRLNTSRRTQHPTPALSPFLALSDGGQLGESAGPEADLETLPAEDALPDVPKAALAGAFGYASIHWPSDRLTLHLSSLIRSGICADLHDNKMR